MSARDEVREFVSMGPLPDEASSIKDDSGRLLEEIGNDLHKITRPVTRDEAKLLMNAFGPDNCFGLAWTLVHLIESAPGGSIVEEEPPPDANEWVRHLWIAAENGRRWGKKK